MASCAVNEECKAFVWESRTKRCRLKKNVRTSIGRNGRRPHRGYICGVVPDCFNRTGFTTPAPTTTTTTTTLPPPPPPKTIKVTVRDAETNDPVERSLVEATLLTDTSYSEMTYTNSMGIAKIFVTETGKYSITAEKRDYIVGTGRVLIRAQAGYKGRATVTTSRILPAGTLRMIMNWQENPQDMDLHAYQVNMEDKEACQTYYRNMNSCIGVKQDLDNRLGGLESPETITISDISTNSHYTYMVFIDDYSNHGRSLQESEAELTVTDGLDTKTYEMPDVARDGSSRYWLVGCIIISEEGWNFEYVNRLTKDDPSIAEPSVCHDMVVPPPPTQPPFWPGAEVKVVIKNGVNNKVVNHPGVSVIFDQVSGGNHDRKEVSRMAGTMTDGEIIFPITSNGEYSIEVTADGYTNDVTKFWVICNVATGG